MTRKKPAPLLLPVVQSAALDRMREHLDAMLRSADERVEAMLRRLRAREEPSEDQR